MQKRRDHVSLDHDKVAHLRRCVVHAQMRGDYTRTLHSTMNEAVDYMIAELEKRHGPPPDDLPGPRPGRPMAPFEE